MRIILATLLLLAGHLAFAEQKVPVINAFNVDLKCPADHTRIVSTTDETVSQFCVLSKDKATKDGPYEIRTLKPATVQEEGVYKMGKALPSFRAPTMAPTEKEARGLLMSLRNNVINYRAESGFFTTDLVENAFLPTSDTAFSCGFKTPSAAPPKVAHNLGPVDPSRSTIDNPKFISGAKKKWNFKYKYIGKAKIKDFPPSGFTGETFKAACVLKTETGVDIWTIDEKGNIQHPSAM